MDKLDKVMEVWAVSWFRWLESGLLRLRSGFDRRPFHVGLCFASRTGEYIDAFLSAPFNSAS
jgi:hypothetical protein